MEIRVPYTVIMEDEGTGSVCTRVVHAPLDTSEAQRFVTMACPEGMHVMALVKGAHPVIPGIPTSA